jgi:hypothetical protein
MVSIVSLSLFYFQVGTYSETYNPIKTKEFLSLKYNIIFSFFVWKISRCLDSKRSYFSIVCVLEVVNLKPLW